jgi:hypothetical protein
LQDAFAATYYYNPATDGTKAAFTKKKVIDYMRGIVQSYEVQKAADAAAAATGVQVTTDFGGIT